MQTYWIRRQGIAADANGLDAALMRLREFEELPSALQAQWLHSYALHEADGRLGLACVFQADSAETLQRHARATQLRADEILPVLRALVPRPLVPAHAQMLRRRGVWQNAAEFERSAASETPQALPLCRYVVQEHDGTLGSVSLYQAVGAEALEGHTVRADVAFDEATPVICRVVFREVFLDRPTAFDAAAG